MRAHGRSLRTFPIAMGIAGMALLPDLRAQTAGAPVRFVSPRDGASAIGESVAEVQVEPSAGRSVQRVEFRVDGVVVSILDAPPWKTTWDAGDGDREHRIEARVLFDDGSAATATVRTSRLKVDLVEEVALVNVYAIARDAGGNYVTDLGGSDFRLLENGRPQRIERFSAERKPLRIAIVMDTSLSMRGDKLKAAKEAVISLLDVIEAGDEGLVVTFSDDVQVAQPLTADKKALRSAIDTAEAVGGTALYDAVWKASETLREFDGRRVMVLLSDGRDEAANGLEPGSLHTLDEALDRSLRDEVMIFVVGLGAGLARDVRRLDRDPRASVEEMDFYGKQPLASILRRMAETTGGRGLFSSGPGELKRTFGEVAQDLRHQYSLAYNSDDASHDGKWRAIEVRVTRPNIRVTHRKGYFAPRSADKAPRRG